MTKDERAGYAPDFPWDAVFIVPDVQSQSWWLLAGN